MKRPVVAILLLAACAPASESTPTELSDAFHDAADRYDVPYAVLASTSYAVSRYNQRDGAENREGGVGVMNLRQDQKFPSLDAAALALDVDRQEIVDDPRSNILAAGALFHQEALALEELTGEKVDTMQEWYPIVAAWGEAADPLLGMGFAEQVYNWIQFGLVVETPDGELVSIPPNDMPWRSTLEATSGSGLSAQFVPACSSNYSDYSRGGSDVKYVVIHTMEGTYSGSIAWFQNCSAQVSAHYSVRSSDGQITQSVGEEDVAWHAGYWDYNLKSIGIEHEGYVSDPGRWYTDAMYRASAALTRDVCDRYGIPKDRSHIIGHNEVPGCSGGSGGGSGCHTDPGSGWDWDYYMSLVNETGSGSTSMGGTGAADTLLSGRYDATVDATRYGETDTCSGAISGAITAGQFYLSGSCTLDHHASKVSNKGVVWSGTISGDKLEGKMMVDGRSAEFTGTYGTDGSLSLSVDGAEDLGGTTGVIEFKVNVSATP